MSFSVQSDKHFKLQLFKIFAVTTLKRWSVIYRFVECITCRLIYKVILKWIIEAVGPAYLGLPYRLETMLTQSLVSLIILLFLADD